MKLLHLANGKFAEVDVAVSTGEVISTSPNFTYTLGNLTRIDYSDTSYKLFTYNVDGSLNYVDYFKNTAQYRKSFYYDISGNLDYILEGYM